MLKIRDLNKKLGAITIVENFSIDIKPKTLNVLVGKNGSGKTTLLKLLCGLEDIDSGYITIDGELINKKTYQYKGLIGFYFDESWLIEKFTVREFLTFIQTSNGIKLSDANKHTLEWLNFWGIADNQKHIETFSTGLKKIVGFVSAVILNRKLVLLDEPFENMDDANCRLLAKGISKLMSEKNVTFIISAHNTAQISDLLIIDNLIQL